MEDQVCALAQHTAHLISVKDGNFVCLQDINNMFFHAFSASWKAVPPQETVAGRAPASRRPLCSS